MKKDSLTDQMYELPEAARLLRLPGATLGRWLNGYKRNGTQYAPVLREVPGDDSCFTWGEFIEAAHLLEYRLMHKVSMGTLRDYMKEWRDYLGVKYPLAHRQAYVGVKPRMRYPWAKVFKSKVEFENGVVRRVWLDGKENLVLIDPGRSFGIPTVRWIRAEILHELVTAGDDAQEIADDYSLKLCQVQAAIKFENLRQVGKQVNHHVLAA